MSRGISGSKRTELILAVVALFMATQSHAQEAPANEQNVSTTSAAAPAEIEIAMANDDRLGTRRRPERDELKVDQSVFEFEATVQLANDYRYRGLSMTDGKASVQAGISVEHQSGLYGSLWAGNVADNGGSDVEVDAAIGFTREFAGITAEIGAINYMYPGVSNGSYYEVQASLTNDVGPVEINVGIAYSPHQSNLGGADNVYGSVGLEMPVSHTPLTLKASVGLEDGAFGDRKVDWLLGASYDLKGFDLGVSYIDTARSFGEPYSGAKALFSIGRKF